MGDKRPSSVIIILKMLHPEYPRYGEIREVQSLIEAEYDGDTYIWVEGYTGRMTLGHHCVWATPTNIAKFKAEAEQ